MGPNKTYDISKIRNFSIIAHIDHGKSTLADRLIEETGVVKQREMRSRMLDTLDLEQERGITIKLQTVRMEHSFNGDNYILNLIDTPGHVDFSYEVSRSLAASEGALLLVDATQGIQAQTLTTVYKALENDLSIIPIINKIDLKSAMVDRVRGDMVSTFGFKEDEIILASGKTGVGVKEILDSVVMNISAPKSSKEHLTRALIFDSFYDEHKGVVILVKVVDGEIKLEDELVTLQTDTKLEPLELGFLKLGLEKQKVLQSGEVGYIATGLKDIKQVHIGDTITLLRDREKDVVALKGYKPPKSMVFASLYPVEAQDFDELKNALEKLSLNDSSLTIQRENSVVLGSGFVCGFLGLLHLEITQERLEREFEVSLITTTPSVEYHIKLTTSDSSKIRNINSANIKNGILYVRTAAEFPDASLIEYIEEPWVGLEIVTPDDYIGSIMELVQNARGIYRSMEYISDRQIATGKKHVILRYEIPTAEIIVNFFDKLKSVSQGFASMDYDFLEYRRSDIVKVLILVNQEVVEALSFLTFRDTAQEKARRVVKKLKDLIPRQQFKVPIQGAIGGKIIARETIPAYRKDVTAKLYGGDVTRKKKLLEKQKKGKKRLKTFGRVQIPKEVFLNALKN